MATQFELVRNWDCDSSVPAHRRLARVLAVQVDTDTLANDTLGKRNWRYLKLHEEMVGREMEAQARCPQCETLCEFPLPRDAMLATQPPGSDIAVELRVDEEVYRFRLPNMEDIAQLQPALDEAAIAHAIAERCLIDDGEEPLSLPQSAVQLLSAKFDEADPLASPSFGLVCEECANEFSASIDLAEFVARGLDHLVDRLLRDVDRLAQAYGWNESEILAIPPARRARYFALQASADRIARPVAV